MPEAVFVAWLRDARRALVGWGLGLVGVATLYGLLWRQVVNPQMRQILNSYPHALLDAIGYRDLTAASYLTAQVYGLVGAALVIAFAVSQGARMVAGEEEAGLLEVVLAHPLSRRRLLLQRYGAFAAALAAMCAALWLVLSGLDLATHVPGVDSAGFAAMSVHLWVFGLIFGAAAAAVGAATGRRALALGTAITLAVVAFLANGLLSQAAHLRWTRELSPFYWLTAGSPLQNGLQAGHLLLAAGLAALLVAAGLRSFERRDLGG